MVYIKLKVFSKVKNDLIKFSNFLKKKSKNSFFTIHKNIVTPSYKKKVTLLKAPHVYKTAQEQFEFIEKKRIIIIWTTNKVSFFKLIKKNKIEKFSSIKVFISLQDKKFLHLKLSFLTLNAYTTNKFKKKKLELFQKSNNLIINYYLLKKYLTALDIVNEINTNRMKKELLIIV